VRGPDPMRFSGAEWRPYPPVGPSNPPPPSLVLGQTAPPISPTTGILEYPFGLSHPTPTFWPLQPQYPTTTLHIGPVGFAWQVALAPHPSEIL